MSTVNFSVAEDVRQAFNETFAGRNKGAVLTQLMRDAVAEARHKQGSHDAIRRIVDRHADAPVLSAAEQDKARKFGRP